MDGNKSIGQFKTIGFNPYFQSRDQIANAIYAQLLPGLGGNLSLVNTIYYYGAGCSNNTNCKIVQSGIATHFKKAKVEVAHDLLAAARALCLNKPGIACILGTGSNSCLYDGVDVIENVPSVGFLWGDHGSGASLGKTFLDHYFHDKLPLEIKNAFEKEGYHREEILDNVYKKSMPSKYLASMSQFVYNHKENDYVRDLIISNFKAFFEYQVSKYTNAKSYKINTVGSIGFLYKDFLQVAAKEMDFELGIVIKSPIEGLIAYHKSMS